MTGEKQTEDVQEEGLDLTSLDALASQARNSEDREAYHVISGRKHFRIGLVATAAPDAAITFRIEVLLQILAKETQPKVAELDRMNKILEKLVEMGYSLDHHDSCWVSCEREVAIGDVEKECQAVIAIMR